MAGVIFGVGDVEDDAEGVVWPHVPQQEAEQPISCFAEADIASQTWNKQEASKQVNRLHKEMQAVRRSVHFR